MELSIVSYSILLFAGAVLAEFSVEAVLVTSPVDVTTLGVATVKASTLATVIGVVF